MNTVKVSAEHDYEVLIGCDWNSVLIEKIHNRTRVAVIASDQYSPDLSALKSLHCDLHVFEVPDGEDGKSSGESFLSTVSLSNMAMESWKKK